jgi:hypothetical protein
MSGSRLKSTLLDRGGLVGQPDPVGHDLAIPIKILARVEDSG